MDDERTDLKDPNVYRYHDSNKRYKRNTKRTILPIQEQGNMERFVNGPYGWRN